MKILFQQIIIGISIGSVSGLRDLISFSLLIAILLIRPSGLFGVDVQEKA